MRRMRNAFASFLICLPLLAPAAGVAAGDFTGLWSDARHPGWGIGLFQQNDTIFATLFMYDASGAPAWFFASSMQGSGVNVDPCGSMSLSGPLYRAQWPGFSSPTNPQGSVQVQRVGTLAILLRSTLPGAPEGCDRNRAFVEYAIDNSAGSIEVARLSWASNLPRLFGHFSGGLWFRPPPAACPDENALLPASSRQIFFTVSADGSTAGGLRILWGTGIDKVCEVNGSYTQAGQLGQVSGTLSCGPIGFPALAPTSTVQLSGLSVSEAGFVGEIAVGSDSCRYTGTLAGARLP
ncbi:MAG: hypothetical protein ACXWHZ_10675 [Usitatibacter sp.]